MSSKNEKTERIIRKASVIRDRRHGQWMNITARLDWAIEKGRATDRLAADCEAANHRFDRAYDRYIRLADRFGA